MNRHWESQWSKLSMETLSLLWWGLWWCYLPHAKITPEFILELDYGKKKNYNHFLIPHQLAVNHFVNYCLIFLRQSFYFKYFTWKSKKKVSKKVFLSIKPISHYHSLAACFHCGTSTGADGGQRKPQVAEDLCTIGDFCSKKVLHLYSCGNLNNCQ